MRSLPSPQLSFSKKNYTKIVVSKAPLEHPRPRRTYVITTEFLFLVKLTVMLVDAGTEVARVAAESDVQVFPRARC